MESINVYVRKEDANDSGDCDVWDDTILIKAYNKAVKSVKKRMTQEMSGCNGTDDGIKQHNHESDKSEVKKEKGIKNPRNKQKWKAGDFCRAVYYIDGVEYEATVVKILPEGKCIVKYCGYGNEETVKVKDLKPSSGVRFRFMQEQVAAGQVVNSNSDVSDSCIDNNEDACNFGNGSHWTPSVSGVPAVPPPPAFNLSSQFNQDNESDALSAMLMSWYMTGYHTGYYQGMMQGKKKPHKASSHKK